MQFFFLFGDVIKIHHTKMKTATTIGAGFVFELPYKFLELLPLSLGRLSVL